MKGRKESIKRQGNREIGNYARQKRYRKVYVMKESKLIRSEEREDTRNIS
jgi:hypothetical protein